MRPQPQHGCQGTEKLPRGTRWQDEEEGLLGCLQMALFTMVGLPFYCAVHGRFFAVEVNITAWCDQAQLSPSSGLCF